MLARKKGGSSLSCMISDDISRAVLELPPEDRLELARRLVESVAQPSAVANAIQEGIRRIEDVASGRVAGLSKEQYRAELR